MIKIFLKCFILPILVQLILIIIGFILYRFNISHIPQIIVMAIYFPISILLGFIFGNGDDIARTSMTIFISPYFGALIYSFIFGLYPFLNLRSNFKSEQIISNIEYMDDKFK
jgi:uncharacterized membrane protein YedE/YeeE